MRIDSHCHVFQADGVAPPRAVTGAAYAPPAVDIAQYRQHLDRLGCSHGVLVQPSSYGIDDHGILLHLLRSDPERLRGVACVRPDAKDSTLAEMSAAGVVATRVQDGYPGGVPVTEIRAIAERAKEHGWHIEIWSDLRQHLSWLPEVIADLGVDVVLDHLAYIPSDEGLDSPAMQTVLELLGHERVWVTLSGAERLLPAGAQPNDPTALANHDAAILDRVQAFVETAPDRVLWGSDWPHVGLGDPPSVRELLSRWGRWVPDAATRTKIMRDNNGVRYGFVPGEGAQ